MLQDANDDRTEPREREGGAAPGGFLFGPVLLCDGEGLPDGE